MPRHRQWRASARRIRYTAPVAHDTTDETGTKVLEGNSVEPVKFEEFWTIVRPVGPNPWRLSAIQRAV